MTTSIALVCGSFHKNEIERMLAWAQDEATKHGLEVAEVIWVPGAMEVPLALDRLLSIEGIAGAACLYRVIFCPFQKYYLWKDASFQEQDFHSLPSF